MPTAERSIEIAAPAPEVWELISAPGYLEECHPFCLANPVESWPGVGARDRVEYFNGRTLTRSFVDWREGSGYDIEITDSNGPVADVVWRLADSSGGSTLNIAVVPTVSLPGLVRPVGTRLVVVPMLNRYLRAVLRGIEYRVVTGRRVERNQFGRHRWFST